MINPGLLLASQRSDHGIGVEALPVGVSGRIRQPYKYQLEQGYREKELKRSWRTSKHSQDPATNLRSFEGVHGLRRSLPVSRARKSNTPERPLRHLLLNDMHDTTHSLHTAAEKTKKWGRPGRRIHLQTGSATNCWELAFSAG